MGIVQPTNGKDKIASHPKIIDQEQKINLLVSLVTRIDDRQKILEERLVHIIEQNDRIIAALLPPGA